MEEDLSFVVMLSLKEMAMRRVVVNLWKQPRILGKFIRRSVPLQFRKARLIESSVEGKISNLLCPELLKEEMKTIVSNIGMQIENWKNFHKFCLESPGWRQILSKYLIDSHVELDVPILAKLCFTATGMVDYRKTAQELIYYKMFDVVKLFKLACLYCLDDCIPLLWEELPEEIKRMFYKEEDKFRIENSFDLQFCWPYILNGELSKLDRISSQCCGHSTTFYLRAFEYTVQEGNNSAAKYFFGKLTPKEKNACLAGFEFEFVDTLQDQFVERPALTRGKFSLENRTDTLCYFFSRMDREQQLKLFKKYTGTILSFLLDWPWQELCLKLADLFREFLSEEDYEYLLKQMYVFTSGSKYPFGKLFQDFFPRCPAKYRREFVTKRIPGARFLYEIFDFEDSESAKVMFKNLSPADRMRFLSSDHFFELLHHNILFKKLNMVKLCLQEATLSKESREKLKVALVTFGEANRPRIKLQAQIQNHFSQLLDQIYGENKRGLEGETTNDPKKFRSKE